MDICYDAPYKTLCFFIVFILMTLIRFFSARAGKKKKKILGKETDKTMVRAVGSGDS